MLNDFLDKTFRQQSLRTRLTILVSMIGVLAFIVFASFSPFKDQLFSRLYPKPPSHAESGGTPPGNFVGAFEIQDESGNTVNCDNSTNPPTCYTRTTNVKVRVKDTAPLLP